MISTLEKKGSIHVLKHNYIGHLAYIYLNMPYVVPITYYFNEKDNTIISYSGEGHKINAMRKNANVSLGVADIDSVNNWKSILVQGRFEELEGSNGKAQLHDFSLGVKDVIRNTEQRDVSYISEFSAKIYKEEIPIVFRIKIEDIIGKIRKH